MIGVLRTVLSKSDMKDEKLYKIALGWYQKSDPGYKAAALELFTKEELESGIEQYKKDCDEEFRRNRDKYLEMILEISKEKFPIGTLIWSDEGTDYCPNIIVGEPYIGYAYGHIPYGVYPYNFDENERKTVLARTLRLHMNKVFRGNHGYGLVGLEKCINNIENPCFPINKYPFIDLKKFYKDEIKDRAMNIEHLKKKIDRCKNELDEYYKQLDKFETYDPTILTEDYIKQIVKDYQQGKIDEHKDD